MHAAAMISIVCIISDFVSSICASQAKEQSLSRHAPPSLSLQLRTYTPASSLLQPLQTILPPSLLQYIADRQRDIYTWKIPATHIYSHTHIEAYPPHIRALLRVCGGGSCHCCDDACNGTKWTACAERVEGFSSVGGRPIDGPSHTKL